MKVLVTGSNGQLGMELRELASTDNSFGMVFTDVDELDITDPVQVNDLFAEMRPGVVINCAAYTAVDKAEQEPGLAMLVNGTAVGNLAVAAAATKAFLVHISTDYVFDGKGTRPYRETDPIHPDTAYGKSKAAGEAFLQGQPALDGLIIRTSWLYSTFGNNFVKTILKAAREKGSLRVVSDQAGCPTYARDLALAILSVLPQVNRIRGIEVCHYADMGQATWHELAKAAVGFAGIPCTIEPILTKDYPTLAPRPLYSVLDTSRITQRFGVHPPHWKESLRECVARLD